jgi:hypothetical protein
MLSSKLGGGIEGAGREGRHDGDAFGRHSVNHASSLASKVLCSDSVAFAVNMGLSFRAASRAP